MSIRTVTNLSFALSLAGAATFAVVPAEAQKAKDTARISVEQPISGVDLIYDPQPQTTLTSYSVFDSLLWFDDAKRQFGGLLAQSWKQVDDMTVDFTLKQGIKFHNGSDFDADDVVYMISVVTDPKNNFRFKENRYGWIEKAEKLGKYQVRIKSKEVDATFLQRTAIQLPIYPSDVYSKLESKALIGKTPIGTGPYKVVNLSDNQGVTEEKWDGYKHGNYSDGKPLKKAGGVKRLQFQPIPDKQSQVAELIVGNLEIMYEVNADQAKELKGNKNLNVLVYPTVQFSYLAPDAANRSGINVFKDERVRRAMFHAVDRETMKKAFLPEEALGEPLPQAMCHPWHVACTYSSKPPAYDPAKAKALLKEAGLEGGFDVALTTWGASSAQVQAVAGYLRAVGIRASANVVPFGVYNKLRNEGKVQTFLSFWDNGGAQPDVSGTALFFFDEGVRNYSHDAKLTALANEGKTYTDLKKRQDIYRQTFDLATDKAYFFPLIPMPAVVVHSKDIVLEDGHKSPKGFLPNYLHWAK